MKTTTMFEARANAKTKKRAARNVARVSREEAVRARAREEAMRVAREGSVVIVTLELCGGSPAWPARWTKPSNKLRVRVADVRVADSFAPGWGAATHLCGVVPCRLATAEETAAIEALEDRQERDPRPLKLWRGRPVPHAPRFE